MQILSAATTSTRTRITFQYPPFNHMFIPAITFALEHLFSLAPRSSQTSFDGSSPVPKRAAYIFVVCLTIKMYILVNRRVKYENKVVRILFYSILPCLPLQATCGARPGAPCTTSWRPASGGGRTSSPGGSGGRTSPSWTWSGGTYVPRVSGVQEGPDWRQMYYKRAPTLRGRKWANLVTLDMNIGRNNELDCKGQLKYRCPQGGLKVVGDGDPTKLNTVTTGEAEPLQRRPPLRLL